MEGKSQCQVNFYQRWFGRSKIYEFEIILFGFALVLGNRNVAWNGALVYGYDALATNIMIVGSTFICLCLCMGEMTSALPFSGGIYGFVRAATGPYYGFVVACIEIIFCLSYQIIIMNLCISIPIITGSVDISYSTNLIFIIYGFNLFLNLLGGKPFWMITCVCGFVISFLLICFLFGTLVDLNTSNINFTDFCETNQPVTLEALMGQRLGIFSQFQGLQYLPLLSEYAVEPRKTIPRAMMTCAITFLTFSIFISLAACSTFPGQMILQLVPTPLMFGFQNIFKTDLTRSMWLHFPGMYAPTLTFLYCSGRQLSMIAKSGFLPSCFTYTMPQTGTPMVTLTLASIIGAGVNVMLDYYPDYGDVLTSILLITCQIVFINAFIAYLFFCKKYKNLPRSFINPLGVWAAYYGIMNNLFGLVSIFKYTSRTSALIALYILLVYLGCLTLFYWVYLVKRQKFSDEEKKFMFKAYLINANREKRVRLLRNNRVASAPSLTTARSSASENKSVVTRNKDKDNKDETPNLLEKDGKMNDPFAGSTLRSPTSPNEESNRELSVSTRIVKYVSEKLNAIPTKELQEYQQLAVLSAGGIIDSIEERAFEERLGMNDIEQSINNYLE